MEHDSNIPKTASDLSLSSKNKRIKKKLFCACLLCQSIDQDIMQRAKQWYTIYYQSLSGISKLDVNTGLQALRDRKTDFFKDYAQFLKAIPMDNDSTLCLVSTARSVLRQFIEHAPLKSNAQEWIDACMQIIKCGEQSPAETHKKLTSQVEIITSVEVPEKQLVILRSLR